MTIKFTKMHGLGNDFIIIDAINQTVQLTSEQIAHWSDRRTGIGFDQCLLVEKSKTKETDFFYRIFNADGSEVGQCGNGARCLARFIRYYNLSNKPIVSVATSTTQMQLQINQDHTVTIDFGHPKFSPDEIPIDAEKKADHDYCLTDAAHSTYRFHAVNVGNPHAVVRVDKVATIPVEKIGRFIGQHSVFPEQANVGFMEIITQNYIKLRVFERGSGETQACGSGAVAAAAVARLFYRLDAVITVELLGGALKVEWPTPEHSIELTGPATFVYEGIIGD